MASLSHEYGRGWRVVETFLSRDDKGNEVKTTRPLSSLGFHRTEDALAYFRVVHPEIAIELRCDCCNKTRPVEPEPVCDTFLLTCKGCRSVSSTHTPLSDAEMGKPMKRPRPGLKETRADWLRNTAAEVRRFGMTGTGIDALDRAMRLECAPLKPIEHPVFIDADSVPPECQLCDCTINGEYVDGVVRGAGWAYLCCGCHAKHGVGLGMGRGQRYTRQDDGRFLKVEG